MSVAAFYHHKAEQCASLAAAATDPRVRLRYEEEATLWHDIANDIAKRDRDEAAPP